MERRRKSTVTVKLALTRRIIILDPLIHRPINIGHIGIAQNTLTSFYLAALSLKRRILRTVQMTYTYTLVLYNHTGNKYLLPLRDESRAPTPPFHHVSITRTPYETGCNG